MSESILKALMRLFAIIANVNKEGVSSTARMVVESYLKLHLSQKLTSEYLQLFDEYLAFHGRDRTVKDGKRKRKRTSANSVKVLMICEQINEELQQSHKILVLLQLLEFVNHEESMSEKELEFIKTVADIFNISQTEYMNIKTFVLNPIDEIPRKEKLLLINSDKTFSHDEIKHIYAPQLDGKIGVLHIESINIYVFRYHGRSELHLNGHVIVPYRSHIFDKGSSIRSSKVSPIYYSDIVGKFLQGSSKSKIELTASDVQFHFKNSKNGIQRFNFKEASGTLVGIMGGSGVGKSTLLNVLNGNLEPQQGKICINGYDIYTDKEALEGIVGFIPQDDLLIEELSVYQNLYYNAKLCFGSLSDKEIKKNVMRILTDLDLDEIKDLTVGNPLNKFISGGQRKRLNIALELIREPAVLFVDEPTSGLSSMDSEMVMDLLKEQTLKGKLVIINIHQPSSDIYKLFDKLIIMDKGGYPIYYGNPLDAVVYFKKMSHYVNAEESQCLTCGNVNPEQILQIVEAKVVDEFGKLTEDRKVAPGEWFERYSKNVEQQIEETTEKQELPENQFKVPSAFTQFKIFSIRNVLSKLANRQYLLITFLEAPLLAVILGYFTKFISGTSDNPDAYIFAENENLPAYLFMAAVVALFLGLTVSAEEIIKDRRILKRESFLNLSKVSYLNSKIVVLFFISAIQTFSFVLLGNLILGIEGMTLSYWLILFSASCFANMLGLNISAALDSVVTIYILIPFILVPQLLLSGVIVKFEKLHKSVANELYVPVAGDIMTLRWAYEALAVEQFKHNAYQKNLFAYEKQKSDAMYIFNFLIPELLSKTDNTLRSIQSDENETDNIERNLLIIRNEIQRLQQAPEIENFQQLDLLKPESFDAEIAAAAKSYLRKVKSVYTQQYNKANQLNDKAIEAMMARFEDNDKFFKFKQSHFNNSLSDLLLNKQELHKIISSDERLIRQAEPIYKDPESNWGRAHFYAPVKIIAGYRIDTYWFNIMIIWFTTLLLYITLVFDVLRKLIQGSGKLKFKRKKPEPTDAPETQG